MLVYSPDDLIQKLNLKVHSGAIKGTELNACCPFPHFHPKKGKYFEQTPSFSINIATGAYHCFSCNRGGKTVRDLAQKLGRPNTIILKQPHTNLRLTESEPRLDYVFDADMMALIGRNMRIAEAWLDSRGLDPAMARLFRMGAAKDGSRIFFPLSDVSGKTVGWSERNLTGKGGKWEHRPVGIDRSNILFGFNVVPPKPLKNMPVAITESQTDVVRMVSWGVRSFATLGASVTKAAQNLIAQHCSKVVLFHHNDEPGRIWARRMCDFLIPKSVLVYSVDVGASGFKDVGQMTDKAQFYELLGNRVLLKLTSRQYYAAQRRVG